MTIADLAEALARDLILSVRVVPVPLETHWCIDLLIKDAMEPGSHTETLHGTTDGRLLRASSIDECAHVLRDCGVTSFRVDLDDAVSFAMVPDEPARTLTARAAARTTPPQQPDDADGAPDRS